MRDNRQCNFILILFNFDFPTKRLNLKEEFEKQFVPDFFKSNHTFIMQLIQICLHNPKLQKDFPFFNKLEALINEVWYQMIREHQFLIMNAYNYYQVESEVLSSRFQDLTEELFYSQK